MINFHLFLLIAFIYLNQNTECGVIQKSKNVNKTFSNISSYEDCLNQCSNASNCNSIEWKNNICILTIIKNDDTVDELDNDHKTLRLKRKGGRGGGGRGSSGARSSSWGRSSSSSNSRSYHGSSHHYYGGYGGGGYYGRTAWWEWIFFAFIIIFIIIWFYFQRQKKLREKTFQPPQEFPPPPVSVPLINNTNEPPPPYPGICSSNDKTFKMKDNEVIELY